MTDYPKLQVALTANLLRRGVLDTAIPRDEMAEWAKVLGDAATEDAQAKIAELEEALADAGKQISAILERMETEHLRDQFAGQALAGILSCEAPASLEALRPVP